MNSQIQQLPFLYVNGLNVSVASNTTLTIATGQCRDSTNETDFTVASTLTVNAAVNGVNGLDTGTFAASTIYAVYVIGDSTLISDPACLMSLSATAPVLPSGYDSFRRVGWAVSDGSIHFRTIYQIGTTSARICFYDTPVAVLTAGAQITTFLAIDLSAVVPTVNGIPVLLNSSFTPNTAGNSASLRPTGSSVAANVAPVILTGVVAAQPQKFPTFRTLAKVAANKAEIDYVVTQNTDSLSLSVAGFEDYL